MGKGLYKTDDIDLVKYLVFDATGNLAFQGVGEAVEDGYWTVTLSADATAGLEAGWPHAGRGGAGT